MTADRESADAAYRAAFGDVPLLVACLRIREKHAGDDTASMLAALCGRVAAWTPSDPKRQAFDDAARDVVLATIAEVGGVEGVRSAWRAARAAGAKAASTKAPVLLAGAYLEWAGGDLARATDAMSSHCSGLYIDRPRFPGCDEALAVLRALEAP